MIMLEVKSFQIYLNFESNFFVFNNEWIEEKITITGHLIQGDHLLLCHLLQVYL